MHRICIFKNTFIRTRPKLLRSYGPCASNSFATAFRSIISAVSRATVQPANGIKREKESSKTLELNASDKKTKFKRSTNCHQNYPANKIQWLVGLCRWLTDLLARHRKTCVQNKSFLNVIENCVLHFGPASHCGHDSIEFCVCHDVFDWLRL